jgi:hypothetical protein
MSDADNSSFAGFGKFVPGFDFLQNLASQSAASAAPKNPLMPNLGSWVAPTLNVEEIDKRIAELKAVQFWLDQNATALKATIQALEVQKMTLATLEGMNLHMADIANAFKLAVPASVSAPIAAVAPVKPPASATPASPVASLFAGMEIPAWGFPAVQPSVPVAPAEPVAVPQPITPAPLVADAVPAEATAPAGVVDPMKWWGALTQQFQTIAADAMKDVVSKAEQAKLNAASQQPSSPSGAELKKSANAAKSSPLRSSQDWPSPLSAPTKKPAVTAKATGAKPKSAAKPAVKPAVKSTLKPTP